MTWRSRPRHLRESLDIARELNDTYGVVYETFNLGLAEYLGGAPGAAEALFAESFDLARRVQMKAGTGYALIGLAMAGSDTDPARSARLHGAADAGPGRPGRDRRFPGSPVARRRPPAPPLRPGRRGLRRRVRRRAGAGR